MKTTKLSAFIGLVAIIAIFGITACGGGGGGGGGDPDLEGTITISPNTGVETGTELTATYSGGESVSYQWKKDGSNVGTDSNKYIPTEAGSYTVTVSAVGYKSKTSSAVTVTVPTTYTVTFNSNGGTAVSQITGLSSGVKIEKPSDPTNGDLIFDGWYKDNTTFATAWNFTTDTVTTNITLYAKWKGNGTTSFAIGETGTGGGKIFYYSAEGFTVYQDASDTTGTICHHLEAAPEDMPTTLRWVAESYGSEYLTFPSITGTAKAIGTGKKNTALILAKDADAPAAKACNEYTNNGKSDWFLPSEDELNQLCVNKTYVGNLLGTDWYWSSSQHFTNTAGVQYIVSNVQNNFGKQLAYSVRAVRAF